MILEQIGDILEDLGIPFDYIWFSGEKVAVVKANADYNCFLFEADTPEELLQILEEKKCESI
jgi:hypothetical protein